MDAGRLGDPRTARRLDDLRAAPRATAAGARDQRAGERRARRGTGVEAVDWTADGSAKVLTLQAIEVLRAAGAGLRTGAGVGYQAVAVEASAMPSLSSQRSASIAARAPSPAAVTAWR